MESVKLSVVVPLAPAESAPQAMLADLTRTHGFQVIVSAAAEAPDGLPDSVQWLSGPAGRGRQLNRGSRAGRARWLWFIHADSEPAPGAFSAIERFIEANEAAIGYCRLRFLDDGPRQVALNAIGANLRSRLLGLPYGDQGLCVPADWFRHLGGFREDMERGEDLDFVVRARHAGLRARPLETTMYTSARRYREHGWLATTWRHHLAARRIVRNARRTARSEPA